MGLGGNNLIKPTSLWDWVAMFTHNIVPTEIYPLSSTWPHLNSDVGLEEGEY